jgi:hypothetical protein
MMSTNVWNVGPHWATIWYRPGFIDEGNRTSVSKLPFACAVSDPAVAPATVSTTGAPLLHPVPETWMLPPGATDDRSSVSEGGTPRARVGEGLGGAAALGLAEALGERVAGLRWAALGEGEVRVTGGGVDGAAVEGLSCGAMVTVSTGTGAPVTTTVKVCAWIGGEGRT